MSRTSAIRRFISARVLTNGQGSYSNVADGIQWVTDQGADVINLSLGGSSSSNAVDSALNYAVNNGALVVAAAGNGFGPPVLYPARNPNCVAVSALNSQESLAYYSSYGSEGELAAPGSNVPSTVPGGGYQYLSGTSMATPVVAGTAGLTLAQWDRTNDELRAHLKRMADDIGLPENQQASGRVDAGDGVTIEPGGNDDDGNGGDGRGETSGSLNGSWDSDCVTWNWEFSDPIQVVVELDGPANADFDLFIDEGAGSCPSRFSYSYRSTSPDSTETITINNPDTSTPLSILVDSYSGSGRYTLSVTESK